MTIKGNDRLGSEVLKRSGAVAVTHHKGESNAVSHLRCNKRALESSEARGLQADAEQPRSGAKTNILLSLISCLIFLSSLINDSLEPFSKVMLRIRPWMPAYLRLQENPTGIIPAVLFISRASHRNESGRGHQHIRHMIMHLQKCTEIIKDKQSPNQIFSASQDERFTVKWRTLD